MGLTREEQLGPDNLNQEESLGDEDVKLKSMAPLPMRPAATTATTRHSAPPMMDFYSLLRLNSTQMRDTQMNDGSSDKPKRVGPSPILSVLVLGSYQQVIGQPLAPAVLRDAEAAHWLYEDAPFCILAHNTEIDPRFIYANKAAQHCFEYSWAEFTTLPSRLSAEAPDRAERQILLDQVTQRGFATNYTGIRISRSGRRFSIEDATVWQLLDAEGFVHGQGAMLPHWRNI